MVVLDRGDDGDDDGENGDDVSVEACEIATWLHGRNNDMVARHFLLYLSIEIPKKNQYMNTDIKSDVLMCRHFPSHPPLTG